MVDVYVALVCQKNCVFEASIVNYVVKNDLSDCEELRTVSLELLAQATHLALVEQVQGCRVQINFLDELRLAFEEVKLEDEQLACL